MTSVQSDRTPPSMQHDSCACGLLEDPEFFRAVLQAPSLTKFHQQSQRHLQFLEKVSRREGGGGGKEI